MGDRLRTTDAEIDGALMRAAEEAEAPTAVAVRYSAGLRLLIVTMKSGRRIAIPVEELQTLAMASRSKVSDVRLENYGTSLHWPRLDLDLSVEGLLKGVTGNRRWMEELRKQRRPPGKSKGLRVLVGR